LQCIILELTEKNLPWAWPNFKYGSSRFLNRPSVVFDTQDSLQFYGYASSITYSTYPKDILPVTCNILIDVAKSVGVTCNSIHAMLYSKTTKFGWHDDHPLLPNTPFMIFRLGQSRMVEFQGVNPITIGEGDAYVVRPQCSKIKHRVPLKFPKNDHQPLFHPIEEPLSITFVLRSIPISKKYTFRGQEMMLIPSISWTDLIEPPPSHGHLLGPLPCIGKTFTLDHLYYQNLHPDQLYPICKEDGLAVSAIFGKNAILMGHHRTMKISKESKLNKCLFKAMQKAKVLRIFMDIYSCPSTLNIQATKNGLFYAFSVSIESDIINYQFCEDPAPESWRYEQLPKFITLLEFAK